MNLTEAIADALAPRLEPGSRVLIDGRPCTIIGADVEDGKGAVWDYRDETTGRTHWISAHAALVRMERVPA